MQTFEDSPFSYSKRTNTRFPLNQILYGVSGTGKTFLAAYYALAIVENKSLELLQSEPHEQIMNRFRAYQLDGQIEWLTLHHHYSYSALIQAYQPHGGKQDGLWKRLADRAQANYDFATRPRAAQSFRELLNVYIAKHINPDTEEIEFPLVAKRRDYASITVFKITEESLHYRRNHKKDTKEYILSLPALEEAFRQDAATDAPDCEAVAHTLKEYALAQPSQENTLQHFVLVLDEMQSVNLPALLGEGLSLLESDRRSGAPNALSITLPSGDVLRFPPNLFLVGTWNTSDCALPAHSGLLRKCAWVECATRYDLIEDEALRLFCEALNEALERELQKPALVGHTYFLGQSRQDLPILLQQHLLPLLKELLPSAKKIEQIVQTAKAKAGI